MPPAPAARLPAAQGSSWASHPPAPRPRPASWAPSRHQSQPNRPSKDRALGWAHANPTSREAGAGPETTSPARGGPAGRFSLGDRRLTPVLQRLAVTPTLRSQIAAPPSPRRRRAPATPSTVPTGVRRLPARSAAGDATEFPSTDPGGGKQTSPVPPQCAADSSRSGCGRPGRGRPLAGGRRGRSPRHAPTALRSRPLAGPSSRTPRPRRQFPGLCPELRARRLRIGRRG